MRQSRDGYTMMARLRVRTARAMASDEMQELLETDVAALRGRLAGFGSNRRLATDLIIGLLLADLDRKDRDMLLVLLRRVYYPPRDQAPHDQPARTRKH
jgi:hypothetical protein